MRLMNKPSIKKMFDVEVENVSGCISPDETLLLAWAEAAAPSFAAEVYIRIVNEAESAELNQRYRGKIGSTNVLSFPCEVPEGVPNHVLGDLVICAPVVEREAIEQGKPPHAHWAHMVVHGLLHLQGYDHQADSDAEIMEAKEILLLDGLGFLNPYEEAS